MMSVAGTTIPVADINNIQDVNGLQESTYTSEEEQVDTATSTHRVATKLVYDEDVVIQKILDKFPEAPIMVEVARCESNLNPSASRKGIDQGLFQINQVHLATLERLGLDPLDLEDNLTYARILYDEAGTQPWYMSEHCWG